MLALEWSDSSAPASAAAAAASSSAAPLRRLYVGWQGDYLPPSNGESMGQLGLPALFAQSLNMPEGVRVHVTLISDKIGLASGPSSSGSGSQLGKSREMVALEPLSSDEWEILELNAGALEMGLLTQIQVVNPGQTFPVWIGGGGRRLGSASASAQGGVCIRMKHAPSSGSARDVLGGKAATAGASSVPFYKLTLNSEISIVPKPRQTKRAAAAAAAVVPSGPPPPIAKLRVQPWQSSMLAREVAQQRREQRDQARAERLRAQESKMKEWDEQRISGISGVDFDRPLHPSSAFTASVAAPAICALTSPHYVHVSPATLRYLQVEPHSLVVLSYLRTVPGAPAVFPAPPSAPTVESCTSVLRIAESASVFEDAAAASSSYTASAPHHILLPPALRLSLQISDFECVHVQKLVPAANARHAGSSAIAQRMRVQESTQRIQSIRLREIIVHAQTREKSGSAAATQPTTSSTVVPAKPQLPAASSSDEQNVSGAFLEYIRAAAASDLLGDGSTAVPLVNGACISLMVPSAASASSGAGPAPAASKHRRFFSVHFNEVEVLRTLARGGAAVPVTEPDDPVPVASAGSGVKVSMATSYFLLRDAASAAQSAALLSLDHGKKKKKKSIVPAVLPLPTPLLHPSPQELTLELDAFEDGIESVLAVGESGALGDEEDVHRNASVFAEEVAAQQQAQEDRLSLESFASLAPSVGGLAFEELGGGRDWSRNVVTPLWRFLRSALTAECIATRAGLIAGAGEDRSQGSLDPTSASAPLGDLMLVGPSGVGRSTLLWSVCRKLRYPNTEVGVLVRSIWVESAGLVSRKLSEFRRFVHDLLFQRVLLSPGANLVVFDDLDKLLPNSAGEGGGGAAGDIRVTQLAEILYDELDAFHAAHPSKPLALVAVCSSTSSHHATLSALFPHVLSMSNPNAEDREDIVAKLVAKLGRSSGGGTAWVASAAAAVKLSKKVELAAIARRTEGYTPSDLKQLVTRVLHAAITRTMQHDVAAHSNDTRLSAVSSNALQLHSSSSTRPSPSSAPSSSASFLLQPSDFDAAFRGFVPSALKELALGDGSCAAGTEEAEVAPTAGWDSIGGLFALKRTLLDTLELPTRYSLLFSAAPLKLRSGLLIYGPPGCGKTLLASHVASKCGLNFLAVKGPELLNKYIGSSEQNVREIFTKARNAAPALLFFDEMDAIVPKRGGDSTGVTDRVVNQFLCELDGVEGAIAGAKAGKQLYVLGASSRPDLIDPALLRPGRLDKALYCGLPSHSERVDMLRRMCSSLHLGPDVDVEWVADRTEEYTPADLQAIVTNAQMALVQEVIARVQEDNDRSKVDGASASDAAATAKPAPIGLPPLTQSHLVSAWSSSKPSTSASDRARYDKIYTKFRLNREASEDKNEFDPNKKQRQALA